MNQIVCKFKTYFGNSGGITSTSFIQGVEWEGYNAHRELQMVLREVENAQLD